MRGLFFTDQGSLPPPPPKKTKQRGLQETEDIELLQKIQNCRMVATYNPFYPPPTK